MGKNKPLSGLGAINAAGAAAAEKTAAEEAEAAKIAEEAAELARNEEAARIIAETEKAAADDKNFAAAIAETKAAEEGKTLDKTPVMPVEGRIDAQMAGAIAAQEPETGPDADENGQPIEPEEWIFVSPHPSIVVYVDVPGRTEFDRGGNPVAVSVPVKFENGTYSTTDMTVAALLRERSASMKQVFRLETNKQALAVLKEAHRQSALIKAGVVGGIATAADDNPAEAAKAQAHLAALRTKAYSGGL